MGDGAGSFDPDRVVHAAPETVRFSLCSGERTRIVMPSAVEAVGWDRPCVAAGGSRTLRGHTRWVGEGAHGYVELTDADGRPLGTELPVRVFDDTFQVLVVVPVEAERFVLARLVLPDHGLQAAAPPLEVAPPVLVRAVRWDRGQARDGEVVRALARVEGAPDGWPARVRVFRHDAERGAHELQADLRTRVADGGVEVRWQATPGVQPCGLATHDELERHTRATGVDHGDYAWPASFVEVECRGVRATSLEDAERTDALGSGGAGLLRHCSSVELALRDGLGRPVPEASYVVRMADGSERRGAVDGRGLAREEDAPPGRYQVTYYRSDRTMLVRPVAPK